MRIRDFFYSFTRICFLWSDSVLVLIPTNTPTRPISPEPSAEGKGGGGDMSQEPEHNEASKILYTIKEHTRITPLAHTNAADVLRGFLPRHTLKKQQHRYN